MQRDSRRIDLVAVLGIGIYNVVQRCIGKILEQGQGNGRTVIVGGTLRKLATRDDGGANRADLANFDCRRRRPVVQR